MKIDYPSHVHDEIDKENWRQVLWFTKMKEADDILKRCSFLFRFKIWFMYIMAWWFTPAFIVGLIHLYLKLGDVI